MHLENTRYSRSLVAVNVTTALLDTVSTLAAQAYRDFRGARRGRITRFQTLRPGDCTPLWNEMRQQLSIHLKRRGAQASLARTLGLPRQRVNEFVTRKAQMPDAERTLMLLAWLAARAAA